jgi:glucan phosphoethanolaminetransferase (alkaline phosphatase superfamily)
MFAIVMVVLIWNRKGDNTFAKVWFIGNIILGLLIIIVYVLFLTNNIWWFFETFSRPISSIMPIGDPNLYIQKSVDNTVNLLTQGSTYILQVPDPSGETNLLAAGQSGNTTRWIVSIIAVLGLGFMGYLSFKGKKRGR